MLYSDRAAHFALISLFYPCVVVMMTADCSVLFSLLHRENERSAFNLSALAGATPTSRLNDHAADVDQWWELCAGRSTPHVFRHIWGIDGIRCTCPVRENAVQAIGSHTSKSREGASNVFQADCVFAGCGRWGQGYPLERVPMQGIEAAKDLHADTT